MTDFRALCAELVSELFGYKVANPMHDRSLVNRACAELDETRGTRASVEQVAQIVYENAMLATAPDHAKPHWPSWADLPNSDARIHALNTAEIILARWGRPVASPAGDGPSLEVLGPLISWLTEEATQAADKDCPKTAGMLTWAAQVVGERVDEDAPWGNLAPRAEAHPGERTAMGAGWVA
jgi:hypothetical protein